MDHIGALPFPADKTALLEAARENNAPEEVLDEIRNLPDQQFNGPQDITATHEPSFSGS